MGELIQVQSLLANKKVNNAIQQQVDKKSKMYEGDFKRFMQYAGQNSLPITFETLESYLLYTVESRLKLSTFNRRSAGVKHFLISTYGLDETADQKKRTALLRQMYNDVQYAEQKKVEGQIAQPKQEVMALIDKLDTRAIKHIDFKNRAVNVYLKKQKEWQTERLTLEVVNGIKDYINADGLDSDSFLVGKVDKHNNYTSVQLSDIAYRKSIHKWLGFAPYTLRKTQVSAMHEAGADLATIAKQSGHKNLETINKHYLSVNDKTVDKYL